MKKLSEERLSRLKERTNIIYKSVCKVVGWSIYALQLEKDLPRYKRTKGLTDERIEELKEQINKLYCELLVLEDDSILEDLVAAHVSGQIKRAHRTLDAVQKELLERVINEVEKRDGT